MRQISSLVTSAIVLVSILATESHATVINVDLGGYRGSESAPPTYVGTGPVGSGTTWNAVTVGSVGANGVGFSDGSNSTSTGDMQSIPATALVNQNGGATPVTFAIGPVGVDNEVGNGAFPSVAQGGNLLSDYVFNNSAGNTGSTNFSIAGVPANTAVTLYFYTDQAGNLGSLAVNGGTAQTFSPTGIFTAALTKEFTVTTNGAGSPITGSLGSGTNVLSGLSISFTATTPEPTSVALMACALVGLAWTARRRRG